MSLAEELTKHFGGSDLYSILGLEKKSTKDEVKKAYRRMALLFHPDRSNLPHDEATLKFQLLSQISNLLLDDERRAVYDETGVFDEFDESTFKETDWSEYWRSLFPCVSLDRIKDFENNYRFSQEEKEDVISAYKSHKGDMLKVVEDVVCSSLDDIPRFREIITAEISNNNLAEFPNFTKDDEPKIRRQKKRLKKESVEAEKLAKKLKVHDEDSLKTAIQKNSMRGKENFDGLLESLAQKYAKPPRKGRKKPK